MNTAVAQVNRCDSKNLTLNAFLASVRLVDDVEAVGMLGDAESHLENGNDTWKQSTGRPNEGRDVTVSARSVVRNVRILTSLA